MSEDKLPVVEKLVNEAWSASREERWAGHQYDPSVPTTTFWAGNEITVDVLLASPAALAGTVNAFRNAIRHTVLSKVGADRVRFNESPITCEMITQDGKRLFVASAELGAMPL